MIPNETISFEKFNQILSDLELYLKYLNEEGVEGFEIPSSFIEKKNVVNSGSLKRARHDESDKALILEKTKMMGKIRERLGECTRCKLNQSRRNIVFGGGNYHPELVFVGEGPGRDEDIQGIPFVGRAGKLLDRILNAMNIRREEIYITNIVKCRPPNNRNPEYEEISACTPFLIEQLDTLQPKIICALGNTAAAFLTGKSAPMTVLRGKFYDFRGICVRPTYHPAALLRNPKYKRPVWEDVQEIMGYLGRPIER